MEHDKTSNDGQQEATANDSKSDAARPGRPSHKMARRRFLAGGVATGPVLLTLGVPRVAGAVPVGTPCHSNSLSRLASFHPGTERCPDVPGH
jgi:hypothetical protein